MVNFCSRISGIFFFSDTSDSIIKIIVIPMAYQFKGISIGNYQPILPSSGVEPMTCIGILVVDYSCMLLCTLHTCSVSIKS